MNDSFFEHSNGKIFFEITGKGEAIIFIHGFTLDHRMWDPQIEFFSKNYQVINYDLRGFGQSSLPSSRYSHHDDLKALLEYLNIDKVHLVGLSLGGEIAIDFVLQYPERVKSLTVLDSSLGGFVSTVDWDVRVNEGLERAKNNWLSHAIFETTQKNSEAMRVILPIINGYHGWHWIHEDLWEKLNPSALSRLYEISVPTLILMGEKDMNYFRSIAELLESKIKNSKRITISNAGHMINLEKVHEVNEEIDGFLVKLAIL